MAKIEGIQVAIGADTSGLSAGLTSAQKRLVTFSKVAAGAIAALPGVLLAMGRASMNAVDAQAKLAKQLGSTTIAVQTMQRAADLSGVSMGALQSASERLNRTLGEVARTGSGAAFDALQRVGLSARELSKLDADERLARIADAIKAAGMSASETADFLGQLGIRQAEVSRMLMDGGDAIRGAREQVQLYGVAISEIDAARIQEANDKWSELGMALRGIGNQIAIQLAPFMTELANKFRSIVEEAGGIENFVRPAFEKLYRAIQLVIDNMDVLVRVAAVFIGLKIAAVVISAGLAFAKLAVALRAATIATVALNVAKGGLVKGLALAAAGAATISAATVGVERTLDALGLSTDALTRDLKDFREEVGGVEGALARLADAQIRPLTIPGAGGTSADAPARPSGTGGAAATDPLAAQREQIAQRLALIKEGFLSEQELLIKKYEEDRNIVDANFQLQMEKFRGNKEMELQLTQEHNDTMQKLEEQHQDKLNQLRAAANATALNNLSTFFRGAQALARSNGDKSFKVAKAFAIAQGIMSTTSAAIQAMADPTAITPFQKFANYAAVLGKGLSAIASIRGMSSSGGGSAGAGAGGGGGTVASGAQAGGGGGMGGGSVYINLQGQTFGRDQVRDLVKQIADFQADGGQVVFA
jgi:hypothetical protein